MIIEPNVEPNADKEDKQPCPRPLSAHDDQSIEPKVSPLAPSTSQCQPCVGEQIQHQDRPRDSATVVPSQEGATATADLESTYHLKWISWNSGKIPIVMQSINGPCPLIATMNVLLLREKVKLPAMLEQITAGQLLAYIGECIMDSVSNPQELIAEHEHAAAASTDEALLNLEQNIHDAIEILPKLKTGLDVNIRFTGITDFEYTPECIVFDLLRIPLYHGWLCDPNSLELRRAINTLSYNQLVDMIITNKTSQDPEKQLNVYIAEEFLESTASQLTLYGLNELRTKIKDNEIGILFRNNHFLTLFKRENVIYTLVTDHGYLTEDNIIWETLDNIEGAGRFMDSNFKLAETTNRQVSELFAIQRQQQLENDFLMALSLKAEESLQQQQTIVNSDSVGPSNVAPTETGLPDFQGLLNESELANLLRDLEEPKRQASGQPFEQRCALVEAEDRPVPERIVPPSGHQLAMVPTQTNLQPIGGSRTISSFQDPDEFPPLAPSSNSTAGRAGGSAGQQQQQHEETAPGLRYRGDRPAAAQATIATSRSQDDLPAQYSYHQPDRHEQRPQQLRTASASSNGGRRSRAERGAKDSNCSVS